GQAHPRLRASPELRATTISRSSPVADARSKCPAHRRAVRYVSIWVCLSHGRTCVGPHCCGVFLYRCEPLSSVHANFPGVVVRPRWHTTHPAPSNLVGTCHRVRLGGGAECARCNP